VAGARAAADLARLAGDEARATAWAGEAEALRAAVRAAAARAAAGAGGAIPPALDRAGGRDWGNLWAAWPTGALDPRDPLVTATLRATRRTWREGIATWGPSLHGYLGFRVLQTELRRGARRSVVDGLYAHLAHTTATHGGFETGTRPWGRRDVGANLTPHGWFAAELVALVREALVHDDAGGIALHEALPPAWLRPGRPTEVRGAPTRFGRVDVTLVPRAGGATLRWSAPEGVPLTWRVPLGVRDVRAPGLEAGATRLRLPAARGELRLRWRLVAPEAQPSLARTVRALREGYARRGRPAPRR
jgi:hypothetical protein